MIKSAQETEKICINFGGGVTCIDVPKNTPKPEIERIKRDLTRGQQRLRQSRQKSAQEETKPFCIFIGGGVTCFDLPQNIPKPEQEKMIRDFTRGQKRLRQSQKIAQIINHGKILSAQLIGQSLNKFFDSKKK